MYALVCINYYYYVSINRIAGSDTVSFTTSMAIILLARHPEKLNKLYNEIKASNKNKNINCGYDDSENGALLKHEQLKGLPYLNAVINETMRLWPVVLVIFLPL